MYADLELFLYLIAIFSPMALVAFAILYIPESMRRKHMKDIAEKYGLDYYHTDKQKIDFKKDFSSFDRKYWNLYMKENVITGYLHYRKIKIYDYCFRRNGGIIRKTFISVDGKLQTQKVRSWGRGLIQPKVIDTFLESI
jgi:hypothetical protein